MRTLTKFWVIFTVVLMGIGSVGGCGTVGPPIAPEDTGIAAKLQKAKEKEKEKEKAAKVEREPAEETATQEDVPLPPSRPIGTR